MSETAGIPRVPQEYSYLGPGGAKNKVEWVSKTILIIKTFVFESTNPLL